MENDIWGEVSLKDGETQHFRSGNLHLWLRYRDEEVWIAHTYHQTLDESISMEAPPQDCEWSRWANKEQAADITISPVFPDMPLVVHSEYALKISPNTRIQIFTRIPVWVRIALTKNDYQLIELPTVQLSRTWFGTPVEGELCYHATTKARRDLSQADKKAHVVSCPIVIVNKSSEKLDFEHFCFRVERLSMYRHNEELWADETQIIYHGEDLNSDVIMTGKLPEGIAKKQLVSKPRKQIQKSLATRTFKRFFEDSIMFGR